MAPVSWLYNTRGCAKYKLKRCYIIIRPAELDKNFRPSDVSDVTDTDVTYTSDWKLFQAGSRPYTLWSVSSLRCFCSRMHQRYFTSDIENSILILSFHILYSTPNICFSTKLFSIHLWPQRHMSNEAIKATALSIPLNDCASPKICFNTCSIIEMVSLSLSGGCNVGRTQFQLPLLLLYDPNSQVIIRLAALWRWIDCCNERKLKLIPTHIHEAHHVTLCHDC